METPDPPSDTPGASKQVVLTPHDIPRSLREWPFRQENDFSRDLLHQQFQGTINFNGRFLDLQGGSFFDLFTFNFFSKFTDSKRSQPDHQPSSNQMMGMKELKNPLKNTQSPDIFFRFF